MLGKNTMKILAEGRHVRLVDRDGWEYVERTKASAVAIILAITDDRRVVLVEQFRQPLATTVIELPAGLVGDTPGDEGEAVAVAAQRELVEETGFQAQDMEYLTHGPPSPGLSTETITLLKATGLRKVGPGGGVGHEDIRVHLVPLDQVADWLREKSRSGVVIDPKIYAGLYFAPIQTGDRHLANTPDGANASTGCSEPVPFSDRHLA